MAFDPTTIPGLLLWLDGADGTTITQSGGAISQWNDKSGNANNAVQPTTANQPTVQTAAQNGLNAVAFVGTAPQSFSLTNPITPLASFTLAMVGKVTAGGARMVIPIGGPTALEYALRVSTVSMLSTSGNAVSRFTTGTLSPAPTSVFSAVAVNGGSVPNDLLLYNAVSQTLTEANSGAAQTSWSTVGLGDTFVSTGFMGEILLYDSALSATDATNLVNYFAAKWATPAIITGSAGTAAGVASAAGVGASRAASTGNAAGISTATAVSASGTIKSGVGTASGAASATAVGASKFAAKGNAAGIASVIAFAPTIASGTGRADGLASVRGISPTVVVVPVGGATWLSPAEIKRQQAKLERGLEEAQAKRRLKNAERERIIREAVAGKPKEVAKPAPEAEHVPEASPEPQEEPKQILATQQPQEDIEALGRHIEAIKAHLGNIKGQLDHAARQRQDEEDELLLLLAS